MKKLLLTSTLLTLGVAGALAQGTANFLNSASLFTDGIDRFVYLDRVGGTKLTGTNYVAELWFTATTAGVVQPEGQLTTSAQGTGTLVVTPNGGARFRSPTTTVPGTWNGSTRTLPGTTAGAGQVVTMQVRVWNFAAFPTFADAKNAGAVVGVSDPFNYNVPAATDPPAAFTLTGLRAFALVPEPSAIALGVLGIGALVLFRRRK